MSDEKRKFQGVWIPADMWLDRSLSITEKVMLVEIGSLESEDRGCYKSNAEFAEFFGLSASRVSEIVSGLAEKGLVTVELIRDGKRIVERQIRLAKVFEKPNTPYSEKAANLFGKGGEGYSEKAEESNTKRGNTRSKPKTSLPDDFGISDRIRQWAAEKGHGRLEERHEHFVGTARAKGYRYVDWDQAFQNAIREDWAKLGGNGAPGQQGEARRLAF
jgi:hypothetical protein